MRVKLNIKKRNGNYRSKIFEEGTLQATIDSYFDKVVADGGKIIGLTKIK
jgi:hypothetical protein